MFHRVCDENDNILDLNTHEEKWKLRHSCIESSRRVHWKINWTFVKMEMFRNYDSSSSSFDSDMSNDNDIIFVSCYPTPTRNAVRP